eukprot:TRINITY_DN4143_c0_g1_i1.p1 TRINITY_DN4143_c0_g1~~TRINITY_DN4143_c0_g1_i1.p1  ORF type:complete len:609 (+),score=214.63 TRINITY_DN4143_c0_g1_i1:76-1827(+)
MAGAEDEVRRCLQELRAADEARADSGGWTEHAARRMLVGAQRLRDAVTEAAKDAGVVLSPQGAGGGYEQRLCEKLYQLTDGFGGVAERLRAELSANLAGGAGATPQVGAERSPALPKESFASPTLSDLPPGEVANVISELNHKMLAKLQELMRSVAETRRAAPCGSGTVPASAGASAGWGDGAYDATLAAAVAGDPRDEELAELRQRLLELQQEREELSEEVECVLEELQQVRYDKEQFEREVFEVHAALVDRLARLREEQACLQEAAGDEARTGEAAQLRRRVADLEAEVEQTRRRLEQVTQESDSHVDRVLQQQISKIEVTLAQVQRRQDATEGETKAAYRQARRLRLDTIYRDLYEGSGMAMLWAALQSVYQLEFAAADSACPEVACEKFCQAYQRHIAPHVASAEAFRGKISRAASLRDIYHVECAKLRCKPNSGVMRLLPALPAPPPSVGLAEGEGQLKELDLSDNFLGDKGLQALLPLLQKMPRLETLRLARNGLQNRGVHALTEELREHPAITHLDLSHNRISRSAGKELVGLIAANSRIRRLSLAGTRIDEALKARIERKLQSAQGTAQEPCRPP